MDLKKIKTLISLIAITFFMLASSIPWGVNSSYLSPGDARSRNNTYTVNASGGGDFTSIQDAIEAAVDGDTIFVERGTYQGKVIIDKMINLIGAGKENTTIEAWNYVENILNIKTNYVTITGFTIDDTADVDAAIKMTQSDYCRIEDCLIRRSGYGISLESSNYNIFINNTFLDNFQEIKFYESSNNSFINNMCKSNLSFYNNYHQDAIELISSSNNVISNNVYEYNVSSSSSSDIHYFSFENSDGNTISNNTIKSQLNSKLFMYESDSNTIINNVFLGNHTGVIYLSDSNYNLIEENTKWGVTLSFCHGTILSNNEMGDYGVYLFGLSLKYWDTHSIDSTNTVNGKPIYFWKNVNNRIVPNDVGQVILANCNGVKIINQNLCNTTAGIIIAFSKRIIVENNMCNNNGIGIAIHSSVQNEIKNNTFNLNRDCIYLWDSDNNNVNNNLFNLNDYGILIFDSDGNDFINNTINSNEVGIDISQSNSNEISYSDIENNTEYGVRIENNPNLEECMDNVIHHNNFVNNSPRQALDDYDNYWSANHWSDWTEPDVDLNGIVDIPYTIPGSSKNIDVSPLVEPYTSDEAKTSNETEDDSDGDGWTDAEENASGSDPNDSKSTPVDWDGDGVLNKKDAYPRDSSRWRKEKPEYLIILFYFSTGLIILIVVVIIYSRIKKRNVLKNPIREIIYNYIKEHPGVHGERIRKKLEMSDGTLRHHLRKLQKTGFIHTKKDGRYRYFYTAESRNLQPLTPIQRIIVKTILEKPKSIRDIAEELGKERQVVGYHRDNLVDMGLLKNEKVDNTIYWSVKEEALGRFGLKKDIE